MNYTSTSRAILVILLSVCFTNCKKNATSPGDGSTGADSTSGNWVKRSEFDGFARRLAVAATIGDSVFLATGTDDNTYFKDCWNYDPTGNHWNRKADFPGAARAGAVSFSINGKIYAGTGYNAGGRLKDFYAYDASTNVWTRVADFMGTARSGAVAFALGNKGYLVTGNDGSDSQDFYSYDPVTDNWTKLTNFPGTARSGAIAFVYQGKAYLCTGGSGSGSSFSPATDMWVFDPVAQSWSKKSSLINTSNNILRQYGAALMINDLAYISTGENGNTYLSDTWEYNIVNDTWKRKTGFEGVARSGAVAFSIKDRGFIAAGRNNKFNFDDLFEFLPLQKYNPKD